MVRPKDCSRSPTKEKHAMIAKHHASVSKRFPCSEIALSDILQQAVKH